MEAIETNSYANYTPFISLFYFWCKIKRSNYTYKVHITGQKVEKAGLRGKGMQIMEDEVRIVLVLHISFILIKKQILIL
ncbi:hypothetical protein Hanom_Chr06g00540171 [Helianthus anomalus]